MYYFEQVFKKIDTKDYVWYFDDYCSINNKRYESLLINAGYKGVFDEFKI